MSTALGSIDVAIGAHAHDVTHRDRALGLEFAHLLGVVPIAAAAVCRSDRRLVDLRVEAERLRRLRRFLLVAHDAEALVGVGVQIGEADARTGRRGEGLGLEDLRQLGLDPDRRELARVAADLVDADRRDHLLDALRQRRADVAHVLGVVIDAHHLQQHVRVDPVGTEAEREHDVVDVADRGRAEHDRAAPAQVDRVRLDLEVLERLVDRRGRQVRIEIAALAVAHGAVGENHQLGSVAHPLYGLLLDPLDGARRRLGLEQGDVDRGRAAAELLPKVLHQPGLVLAGDPAVGRVGERRQVVVAAEDDRERGLDGVRVGRRVVRRRAPPEHRPSREVLHLALAVDRRVGDHGDRLLEVVGQVLALRRQRRQRPVVAERADRLGPVRGHLLAELDVVALPAEAGEQALAHDDGLRGAGGRVAGDVGALERAPGLQRAVVRRGRLGARALEPAARHLALHLRVLPESRAALGGVDRDHELLPRPQRQRLGDHVVDADDAGLGAEDVVLGRLEPPQRPQAERVGGEDALGVMAGDQRHRSLGERAHDLAHVHVERVQVGGQRADLVDDRAGRPSPSPRRARGRRRGSGDRSSG